MTLALFYKVGSLTVTSWSAQEKHFRCINAVLCSQIITYKWGNASVLILHPSGHLWPAEIKDTEGRVFYILMNNSVRLLRSPFKYTQYFLADSTVFKMLGIYMVFPICTGFRLPSRYCQLRFWTKSSGSHLTSSRWAWLWLGSFWFGFTVTIYSCLIPYFSLGHMSCTNGQGFMASPMNDPLPTDFWKILRKCSKFWSESVHRWHFFVVSGSSVYWEVHCGHRSTLNMRGLLGCPQFPLIVMKINMNWVEHLSI